MQKLTNSDLGKYCKVKGLRMYIAMQNLPLYPRHPFILVKFSDKTAQVSQSTTDIIWEVDQELIVLKK